VARGELRAGRLAAFLFQFLRRATARTVTGTIPTTVASHWVTEAPFEIAGNEVVFRSGLSDRWGRAVPGVTLERRYAATDRYLAVVEILHASGESLERASYLPPPSASDLSIDGVPVTRGRPEALHECLSLRIPSGARVRIEIRYRLDAALVEGAP
jgi:hypothetical protein